MTPGPRARTKASGRTSRLCSICTLAKLDERRYAPSRKSAAIRLGEWGDVQFERELRGNFPLKVLDIKLGAVRVARVPLQVLDHLFEHLAADLQPALATFCLGESCVSRKAYRPSPSKASS